MLFFSHVCVSVCQSVGDPCIRPRQPVSVQAPPPGHAETGSTWTSLYRYPRLITFNFIKYVAHAVGKAAVVIQLKYLLIFINTKFSVLTSKAKKLHPVGLDLMISGTRI